MLVPVHPLFGDGGRAERAVWEVLRGQLPDEAVLFQGLRLQERQHEYEADLVVLLPGAGWAVSEVKGGDVRREEGVWEQRQQGAVHLCPNCKPESDAVGFGMHAEYAAKMRAHLAEELALNVVVPPPNSSPSC